MPDKTPKALELADHKEVVPAGEYLPLPVRFAYDDEGNELFSAAQMFNFVDADRAMREQEAPAAVAGPSLYQVMAVAKAIHATTPDADDWDSLRQWEVDALRRRAEKVLAALVAAPTTQPAQVAQGDALTDTYVQQVPDKCDRIVWRGRYYHLPIDAAEHSYTEPSPMAKVAAALRQKAEQEDAAYQARRSDQGLMESEWGPMEDAPPHEDPPMHVAVVEGDDAVRTLQWNRDVAAFAYPVGTLLYAARTQAKEGAGHG